MPRRHRHFIPGCTQHLIQRGNNRGTIYRAPSDYRFFLGALRFAAVRATVAVHGYVLMTNHFHLMATPVSADGVPKMMQTLGRLYVRFFNGRYQRTGALWEGRYRASMLHDDRYWMTCLRYIELNPVRAGLVAAPVDYRWSSYRAHAFGASDSLLSAHALYLGLGSEVVDRQRAWRAICASPTSDDKVAEIRQAIHAGKALGEPSFQQT